MAKKLSETERVTKAAVKAAPAGEEERVAASVAEVVEHDPSRTEKDGGFEGEDLPTVRVGEVFEDVRPSRDDHRRFVKIIALLTGSEKFLGPDDDAGEAEFALVKNEETYHESRIRVDRFTPENGWRRYHS